MHNLRFQPILHTGAVKLMANRGEIWTQALCSRPTALITVLCYTLKELPPSVIPGKAVILNFYTANQSSPPLIMGVIGISLLQQSESYSHLSLQVQLPQKLNLQMSTVQ